MRRIVLILLLAAVCESVSAQKYPERRLIRSGNSSFERGDYQASEADYLKALTKDSASYEAAFNYGNALYRQERFEEAAQAYNKLASSDLTTRENVANSSYNTGNALFGQRQLQDALQAYKNAVRANPDDSQAKFNYAYTKKLLEDQQDEGGGEDDQDDNQDDQDGDKEKSDQKDNEDKNKGGGDEKKDEQGGKQQPAGQQPSGMSREQAEQMLDAAQVSEDKTRDRVKEENIKATPAGAVKNW